MRIEHAAVNEYTTGVTWLSIQSVQSVLSQMIYLPVVEQQKQLIDILRARHWITSLSLQHINLFLQHLGNLFVLFIIWNLRGTVRIILSGVAWGTSIVGVLSAVDDSRDALS